MKKKKLWSPQPLKDNIKRFEYKSTTIAYKFYGEDKNKKTILFFYGFAGNIEYLRYVGEELGKYYSFLCVDYPGHGYSYGQDKFSIPDFIETVEKLLENLSIDKIYLYGYSFGGIVSLMFYERNRAKVEKLILLNSEYYFTYNFIKKIFYNVFLGILKIGLKFAIVDVAIPVLKDKYLTKENYKLSAEVVLFNNHEAVIEFYKSIVFENFEPLLDNVDCPVLLVGSRIDFLISKGRFKNFHSKLKNSELFMVKDVGHLVVATNPYPALKKSLEFLRK
ncbi:MAG TPA: alpha/beta hydrolase [Spirochaetota bacterium]|jgi:pimeloyl-ACP methyl ester carboxylesterase|nr:MAG: Pimeloyl-(acyl-carrier protein) methyl ester esterase [Spirochaetes bacterium ADurb.Bin133]HNZ25745.1 alpha/beta hydrolase [Spirochaetota bacterium]HPY87222.1 alpha/beta hydrolase [Spirochaetota bacterium]HQB61280.1 alpha/beta hydrolase [Spirochaetota bacterium]